MEQNSSSAPGRTAGQVAPATPSATPSPTVAMERSAVAPPQTNTEPRRSVAPKPSQAAAPVESIQLVTPARRLTPPSAANPSAQSHPPPTKAIADAPPSVQIPTPKAATLAAVPLPPPAPTLNLASLETRLRETDGIGVFTKLALKNQVDELLNKFRAFHQGRMNTTLATLRQPYDLLLMKVLSLLQDSDPPLAQAIVASREAIWNILADGKKFLENNLMAGVML
ncbi:MAG: hypothetical protein HYX63_12505 [Gammaproteobacteria bacterium]|nr:hypothetical protein [Gammaproteobacteria bacterium]